MRVEAAAFQNQPPIWLSTASVITLSAPIRVRRTCGGTLPFRNPGILTLSARSAVACSTAWCMSSRGTSTFSRTLLSGSSSTWTATCPFKQRELGWQRYCQAVRLFVLARHAESTLNHENRVNGDPAVPAPLTERGHEEARLLGLQVRELPLDLCLHTRFGRTLETAEIAMEERDVPIAEDDLFDDVRIGDLEGWTLDDYRAWKREHTRSDRFPGGESLDEAAVRYGTAFQRLLQRPLDCCLVVCHEIPIRYALNASAGS